MTPKPAQDKPAGKLWIIPMVLSFVCAFFAGVAIEWWGTVILAVISVGLFTISVWLEGEGV
jgi:hypothetical protein